VEELRFNGRVAIVTGGGRGLGRAYASLLASRGASVVVNDLGGGPFGGGSSRDPADQAAAEISARGGIAIANHGDVSSETDAEALVAQATKEFGRVDILVSNAGIDRLVEFSAMSCQAFEHMVRVHLTGAFQVSRACWRQMAGQRYGRIVMISSRAVFGLAAQAHYAAAKAGVLGLMRALSVEGRDLGISVNAVMPAAWTRLNEAVFADSGLVPSSGARAWSPDLVAPAVAWLAHESCPVTGEILDVGAGYVGRAFFGLTRGSANDDLTIEAIAANWPAISDEAGYAVPRHVRDVPLGNHSLNPDES
jgi:NAD(P)-dependent dehydrogenase (short-subunit alcohol dehydrogenase family)